MLHDLLKQARKDAELTMVQVAERVGMSQSTISRIESGVGNITEVQLSDLCAVYGVSPSQLRDDAVVRSISETDLKRVGAVIEFVEGVIHEEGIRPSPQVVRDTILAIFRQENDLAWETGATFDPGRYSELVSILLRNK